MSKKSSAKYRIKQNVWGNWYGYLGSKKVEYFCGRPEEQEKEARQWLADRLAYQNLSAK